MGGMSFGHWLVVLVIVVLVFGTKRLTSGAKDLGGAVREFKKGLRGDEEARAARLADESQRDGTTPRAEAPREPAAPDDRDRR